MPDRNFFAGAARTLYLKVVRQPGTPEYIARGVALGLLIGFLIPMGGQIIAVLLLAFICRASKVMAIAFTFVSNPLTVVVIYPAQCWIGSYLIFRPLGYARIAEQLRAVIENADIGAFLKLGMQLLASFFAGGLLFGVVAAVIGFYVSRSLVVAYRKHRGKKHSPESDGSGNRGLQKR